MEETKTVINKKFEAKDIKHVEIFTEKGPVTVTGSDTDSVSVDVLQNEGEGDYVFAQEDNGVLKVEIKAPQKKWFTINKNSAKTGFNINMPSYLRAKVSSGSGNIRVTDTKNDLIVNAGTGDVFINNVEGRLKLNCGTGEIQVYNVTKDAVINTGTGDLDTNNMSGAVKINAGTGDVNASQFFGDANIRTGSGDITVSDMLKTCILKSGSGDVRAEKTSGNLYAESSSGDIILKDVNGTHLTVLAGSSDIEGNWTAAPGVKNAEMQSGTGDVKLLFPADSRINHELIARAGSVNTAFDKDDSSDFVLKVVSKAGDIRLIKKEGN